MRFGIGATAATSAADCARAALASGLVEEAPPIETNIELKAKRKLDEAFTNCIQNARDCQKYLRKEFRSQLKRDRDNEWTSKKAAFIEIVQQQDKEGKKKSKEKASTAKKEKDEKKEEKKPDLEVQKTQTQSKEEEKKEENQGENENEEKKEDKQESGKNEEKKDDKQNEGKDGAKEAQKSDDKKEQGSGDKKEQGSGDKKEQGSGDKKSDDKKEQENAEKKEEEEKKKDGGGTDELKLAKISQMQCQWDDKGGTQTVSVTNTSNTKIAMKIRCSDNTLFRIDPVFASIEPGNTQKLEIIRSPGAVKEDKVVILLTEYNDEEAIEKYFKKPNLKLSTTIIQQTGKDASKKAQEGKEEKK
ncbi:hypothetical protein RB195_014864 [Necator americanus]|uniref:Major sperm protein n=1 Tax=Necator americanus TaxID=51031 RepID=A0ABR1E372_NECAM